jgi:phytanoyl-CoA dioxygenase PhyH
MGGNFLQSLFGSQDKKNKAWQPVKQAVLKSPVFAEALQGVGYTVAGKLDNEVLEKLRALYQSLHHFRAPQGGMFYSVYSHDLVYRKKVHKGIAQILSTVYESLFTNYKSVLNSFIVKVSGPESEFSLHQDSTSLDEMRYSCLSVWIPLQDTNISNGCMCVVPHSHKMFSPYRDISFPQPFDAISDTVRKYLQPIELKAGEILLFDNRLVHNSVVNGSGKDRVVVMSGIFPAEAKIIRCYKDLTKKDNTIEIIEQEDDFLLTFENFFHDCTCRPETGKSIGFVDWDIKAMSKEDFVSLCSKYGLKESNYTSVIHQEANQAIIGEPVTQSL